MCVKRSKRCFGYREETDLMWRNETETVVRKIGQISKVGQARGVADPLTHTTGTNHRSDELLLPAETWTPTKNSASLSSRPLDSPGLPSISRSQLDIPDSEQSLSLFFHQYVGLSDGVTPGMNAFLPLFYQQAQPDSCLKHCVAATAYASLANQSKSTATSRKAWESYGKALLSVNAALSDPVESLTDETLSALFVLGMFENISGQELHIFGAHGSGMDRLLHFRGPQRQKSPNGQRISKAVCDFLQIRNLSLERRPPPHENVFFGDPNFSIQHRTAMLSISSICRVRADTAILLTEVGNTSLDDSDASLQRKCDTLTALVAEMQAINNDHWSWSQNAPESWRYASIISSAAPDGTVHVYYNLWMANFWNWARSSCILLQTSMLKCLKTLSSVSETPLSHDSLMQNAQTTIKTMRNMCYYSFRHV